MGFGGGLTMPFQRCETCGKRVEHCECPEADEDDKDWLWLLTF